MNIIIGKAEIEAALPGAIEAYGNGKKQIGVIVASILVHASKCGDASMLKGVHAVLTKRDKTHLDKFLNAFTPVKINEGDVTCKGWGVKNEAEDMVPSDKWVLDVIESNFMDWEAGKPDTPLREPSKAVDSLERVINKWKEADGSPLELRMAILKLDDLLTRLTAIEKGESEVSASEVIPTNDPEHPAVSAGVH